MLFIRLEVVTREGFGSQSCTKHFYGGGGEGVAGCQIVVDFGNSFDYLFLFICTPLQSDTLLYLEIH